MPTATEQQEIVELYREAIQTGSSAELIGPSNRRRKLPPAVFESLVRVLEDLSESRPATLTTSQAAKRLGVSRQHLVDLLESGAIAFHKAGSHRRIHETDLQRFEEERKRRRGILDEMVRDELDLYGLIPPDVTTS